MSQNRIEAHKITKPIQLLAAWLIGLAIVDIAFLTAASQITSPSWVPGLLAIAAVINVPLFVISIFLLQTKFRPEMQEDSYYSDYLNKKNDKTMYITTNTSDENLEKKISEISKRISEIAKKNPTNLDDQVRDLISEEKIEELVKDLGNHRTLSELYLKPERWIEIVKRWEDDEAFKSDIDDVIKHQLIKMKDNNINTAELTNLGRKVVKAAEKENILFAQKDKHFFETGGL